VETFTGNCVKFTASQHVLSGKNIAAVQTEFLLVRNFKTVTKIFWRVFWFTQF